MTAAVAGSLIAVRNLVVSFSRWGQMVTAVDKASIDVPAGEWVLLVGHNGAGKSTLLRAIGGQLRPASGNVIINGRRIDDLSPLELAGTLFTVHQDPLLGSAPLLTVFENLFVADPQAWKGRLSAADLSMRYSALLEPVGLAERMKQSVKLLSGGERQLLAMIIAGLRQAPIILLDEPLAALDPQKTELCIGQISRMHREGKTIIQVAHDVRALRGLADRMVTLKNGQIIADESLQSLTGAVAAG